MCKVKKNYEDEAADHFIDVKEKYPKEVTDIFFKRNPLVWNQKLKLINHSKLGDESIMT